MGPSQDQQNCIERTWHIQFFFFFFGEVNVLKKKTTIQGQRKIPQESISYTRIYDDAVNITSELHVRNDICTEKREDLTKSTGVVLAEYPPKVKLELFSQL